MDLAEKCKEMAKQYNLDAIGLFGSRARGDYEEYSDYDIFIIGDMSLTMELKIEEELEQQIGAEVDLIRLTDEIDKIFLKNIVNDSILFYNKDKTFEKVYERTERFFVENGDFMYFRKRDLIEK